VYRRVRQTIEIGAREVRALAWPALALLGMEMGMGMGRQP
jgi:hypothetical protein